MVSRPAVTTGASRGQSTVAPTAARPSAAVDPANTVGGTTVRRMQQGAGTTTAAGAARMAGATGAYGRGPAGAGAGAGGQEECPQCGARFGTVDALIRHVEEWHPSPGSTSVPAAAGVSNRPSSRPGAHQGQSAGAAAGGNLTWNPLVGARGGAAAAGAAGAAPRGEFYRCTHCGNTFSEPVVLVRHSEACASHRQAVAASGGSGVDGRGAGKSDCTIS